MKLTTTEMHIILAYINGITTGLILANGLIHLCKFIGV